MQIVNIKVIWSYGRFEQYNDSTGTHWRINGSGAENQNIVWMLIIIIISIENINNVGREVYGRFEWYDRHTMIIMFSQFRGDGMEGILAHALKQNSSHQYLTSSVIFTINTKTLLNFARSSHASWGRGDNWGDWGD